jgi:hypothetical protein
LIYLDRVALEIKTVGLYDLILQDVLKIAGKKRVNEDEIIEIINENPNILDDYKQLNVEYNLSNIHLRDIEDTEVEEQYKNDVKKININLNKLREIEKYTLDFEQSSTLVIIFSLEFFVLFSVQYFIVLLDLKDWQWWIYGVFASSVLFAWLYAQKEKKLYAKNSLIYDELYVETLQEIERLEGFGVIKKSELIIEECEEHV